MSFSRTPKAENPWTGLVTEYGAPSAKEIFELLKLADDLDENIDPNKAEQRNDQRKKGSSHE
jgi:hypothetical protein